MKSHYHLTSIPRGAWWANVRHCPASRAPDSSWHPQTKTHLHYKVNTTRTEGYGQGYGFVVAKSEWQERCPAPRRFSSGVNARGLLRNQSSKRWKEPFILERKYSYKNCKTNIFFFPDIYQEKSNKACLSITAEAQKS